MPQAMRVSPYFLVLLVCAVGPFLTWRLTRVNVPPCDCPRTSTSLPRPTAAPLATVPSPAVIAPSTPNPRAAADVASRGNTTASSVVPRFVFGDFQTMAEAVHAYSQFHSAVLRHADADPTCRQIHYVVMVADEGLGNRIRCSPCMVQSCAVW